MRTSLRPWLTERIEAAARMRTNKERVESLSITSFGHQSRWTDQLDIRYEREDVRCTIAVPLGSIGQVAFRHHDLFRPGRATPDTARRGR
jgi:hypothetical protein